MDKKRAGDDEGAPPPKKSKRDDEVSSGEDEEEGGSGQASSSASSSASSDLIAASQGLSEREQLRRLMEQSAKEEAEREARKKEEAAAAAERAAGEEAERMAKVRAHVEEGGASWVMMSNSSARRWWEGSSGFDFMNEMSGKAVADGMLTKNDPGGWTGKIVKRSFGRGVISFGKVLGWFPPEDGDDEVLWHILHADGDEEDLDEAEVREAVDWAEEAENGDAVQRALLEAARSADASDLKAKRQLELAQRAHEREMSLQSMLRGVPKYTSAAADATEAARRGLEFIFQLSKQSQNFAEFGGDIMQTFYDIGAVAPEPLRKHALQRVELLSQKWKQSYMTLRDCCEEEEPKAREIVLVQLGLYSLERVGLEHQLKQQLIQFVDKHRNQRGFTTKDYLTFDARSKFILQNDDNKYQLMIEAMNTSFTASKLGFDLGASLEQVLDHLLYIRPYKDLTEMDDYTEWVDQITMVFNFVHVCSNFGELMLKPDLMPEEFAFLRRSINLETAIRKSDVHIIGELIHCLRIFGISAEDDTIVRGCGWLLHAQNMEDGSWPTRGGDTEDYTRYHASMCAIMGLYRPVFRGYGPGSKSLKDMLVSWLKVPLPGLGSSSIVEEAYTSIRVEPGKGDGAISDRAKARLDGLLAWRRALDTESLDDFGKAQKRQGSSRTPPREGFQRISKAKLTGSQLRAACVQLADLPDARAEFASWLNSHPNGPEPDPTIAGANVDLFTLFRNVGAKGGAKNMTSSDSDKGEWAKVAHAIRLPTAKDAGANTPKLLREFYKSTLEPLESAFIAFMTVIRKDQARARQQAAAAAAAGINIEGEAREDEDEDEEGEDEEAAWEESPEEDKAGGDEGAEEDLDDLL